MRFGGTTVEVTTFGVGATAAVPATPATVVDGSSPWETIQNCVDGSTASGAVATEFDGYRYSDELVSCPVNDNVNLTPQ